MKSWRHGDKKKHRFRNQRLCCENGKWYFQTREGTLIGPCNDRSEARQLLAVFLAKSIQGSPDYQDQAGGELFGAQDGVQHLVEELLNYYRIRREVGDAAALAWAINRIEELTNDRKIEQPEERTDILYYVMDRDQQSA